MLKIQFTPPQTYPAVLRLYPEQIFVNYTG